MRFCLRALKQAHELTADKWRKGRRPLKLPNKANGKGIDMALTGDFKHTIVERVDRDPAFAKALLDEAATSLLNGEPDVARLILRDLVKATIPMLPTD